MRSFLQLCSLLILVSCAGHAPQMERKVKIWNGAPEEAGICRMSSKDLKERSGMTYPLKMIKKVHQGFIGTECIEATDEQFKAYACLTFQDLGVLNAYIEKLIYSCKKW
jgi:hypothetical protein